jgi:predicted  nucleic acid-binding Zn-ribbon protein
VKEQILAEAEALLPVTDLDAARKALHDIADRWEAAGKVPRGRVKELEGRLRAVEQAVRAAGEQEWKRSDPEKSARADDMISKLQRAIDETREALAKAEAAGDQRKVKDLTQKLESNESFLAMAQKAAADYS